MANLTIREIVALVACKIALLQGNNDHYANLILDALYPFVLNETHVNDPLCAVLSKVEHNEQLVGLDAHKCSQNAASVNGNLYLGKCSLFIYTKISTVTILSLNLRVPEK